MLGARISVFAVYALVVVCGLTVWSFETVADTRPDGAESIFAPASPDSAQNPLYSPDGQTLIFTVFHKGYNRGPAGLFRISPQGGTASVVLDEPDHNSVNLPGTAWSSANGRITFSSDRQHAGQDGAGIWMMDASGGNLIPIIRRSPPPYYQEPSFSPDAQWVVFEALSGGTESAQSGTLYKVRTDGTGLTQITSGTSGGFDDRQPNWSPKGDRILFQRRAAGSGWNIYTIKPDGTDLKQVTTATVDDTDASWSPNAQYIVYSSDHGRIPRPNIFAIPAAGGEPARITRDDTREDGAPCWSPDGRWIAFESHTTADPESPSVLMRIAVPPALAAAAFDANPFTIPDRGGVSLGTLGGGESAVVGYGRVQASAGSTTPSGLAIYGFRQGSVLVSEAAVPASLAMPAGRIYAEVNGPVNTGLAIANPNNSAAEVSYYFTDENGQNFGAGTTTVPANGQIARFLNESPFNGGAFLRGAFTFSSSVPVAAIALRGLLNERSEFLITTLPVANLTAAVGETVYFPHFADGGGWTTQIILVNPADATMSGTVQFFSQGSSTASAQPVTLTIEGQTNITFAYSIPARSSRRLATTGQPGTTVVGSARVVPAANSGTPSGVAVFSFKAGTTTVSEAGVPALRAGSAFRMYVEASGTLGQVGSIQSGIAVSNPSPRMATANFELTGLDGRSTGLTGSLVIPGSGQVARFLNQIGGFESLPLPFQGVLRVTAASAAGISIVGLRGRYNERGDFLITTTLPVNESAAMVNAELLFPHFVDGGGYTTQFILFSGSAGQSSTGSLQFLANSGNPINLTLR